MDTNPYEQKYRQDGIYSQRLYPNEALVRFLGGKKLLSGIDNGRTKVLEVGCGSGANLWMMAKEGMEAYGVDSSPTGLRLAEKHLREKWKVTADLREGTFDCLPYEADMFDVVVDIVSLQHIDLEASRKALAEVHRVLKTGGVFFSYRLSDHSVMYQHHGSKEIDAATASDIAEGMPIAGNGTVSFWSPSLARIMYSAAGFVIEEIETVSRTYQGGLYSVEYLAISAKKER